MLDRLLKNILEQPGVDGACIIDKKGQIVANMLPDFFMEDFLDDLARRVTTLFEAVAENYMSYDDYLLKFPQRHIRIRRSRQIYLLVVTDPVVNTTSLRMVTNIVLKHVTPRILSEQRRLLELSKEQTKIAQQETVEESRAAYSKTEAPVDLGRLEGQPTESENTKQSTDADSKAKNKEKLKRGDRIIRPRPSRSFRGSRY